MVGFLQPWLGAHVQGLAFFMHAAAHTGSAVAAVLDTQAGAGHPAQPSCDTTLEAALPTQNPKAEGAELAVLGGPSEACLHA